MEKLTFDLHFYQSSDQVDAAILLKSSIYKRLGDLYDSNVIHTPSFFLFTPSYVLIFFVAFVSFSNINLIVLYFCFFVSARNWLYGRFIGQHLHFMSILFWVFYFEWFLFWQLSSQRKMMCSSSQTISNFKIKYVKKNSCGFTHWSAPLSPAEGRTSSLLPCASGRRH